MAFYSHLCFADPICIFSFIFNYILYFTNSYPLFSKDFVYHAWGHEFVSRQVKIFTDDSLLADYVCMS